jgi:subtilase family serine protease
MEPRAARLCSFVSLCLALLVFLFGSTTSAEEAQVEFTTVQPRILQPVDENQLTVLKGNTHRLARSQFDQGIAPADLPMDRMLLVLKRSPEQDSALHKLLDDQQDKASPNYHKWLTPSQFGKQFGPADQDIQIVTSWLQSHGFRIGQVAKGRNIIEFSGTAAQVQDALHTSIHKYVVNGEEHWANASDPQIPTALTPVVAGVDTLHNFLKKPQIHVSEQTVAAEYVPGKPPLVTFSDGTHALGSTDYATIYNINPLYQAGVTGQGIAIAVVARSNLFQNGQDVSDFRNVFGVCCGGNFPNIVLNGPDPGDLGGGEEFEATLDATWSGAIAPDAAVYFVVSATTNTTDGVDLSEIYIIDNNLANVMTESFGGCEAALKGNSAQAQAIESLAEQAAAQGITYMVSTGDSGAEGCDDPNSETVATGPVSVNVLASTRYTVAVGGTMFNENGQDSKYWKPSTGIISESVLSYIPENVWNESCTTAQCGQNAGIWAGSGGASVFFPKPSWQSGVKGIPADGKRDLPDVSLTAAGHDPYLLCLDGSCVPDAQNQISLYLVGGTSASAPSFAGIMALVDQKTKSRQGQADYVLYKLAATENL